MFELLDAQHTPGAQEYSFNRIKESLKKKSGFLFLFFALSGNCSLSPPPNSGVLHVPFSLRKKMQEERTGRLLWNVLHKTIYLI